MKSGSFACLNSPRISDAAVLKKTGTLDGVHSVILTGQSHEDDYYVASK
jgi:hypothetical protein